MTGAPQELEIAGMAEVGGGAPGPEVGGDATEQPAPTPWYRRGSLADRVCLGGIGVNILVGMITSFMTAYLLARPLWHLALRGSVVAIIGSGALASVGRLNLGAAIACAFLGTIGFDAFYWWAGRRYEHRMAADLRKLSGLPEQRIAQAERIMGRSGFWILVVRYFQPVPNVILQLLAGAGGMSAWRYALASVLGGALWIGVLGSAGWLAGESAVAVVDAITDNALKVTIGMIVLAVLWQQIKAGRELKAEQKDTEQAGDTHE